MSLWLEGSRACQGCGVLVVDGLRELHETFHGLTASEPTEPPVESDPPKPPHVEVPAMPVRPVRPGRGNSK